MNNNFFVLKEWKEIDKKLTQSINEARDHYKFLMIIDKHIGPLYRNDPVDLFSIKIHFQSSIYFSMKLKKVLIIFLTPLFS